ncbi:MAG TPA: prepilin-type N-terminal cleavage/methylation domain-containing protein [Stellaceae bacterium]|nr:prepilin-type N-terminal cleavage/methylation domain-containing protein [Stellaceae bacterium]
MSRGARRPGFTLVEVLIALALTGIVALLMLEGMRFATVGLERASDRADRLEARRSLDALLRRELGATFVAPLLPNAPALVGGAQSLRFLTLAEDGGVGLYRVRLAVETRGGDRALVLTRRRVGGVPALATTRAVLVPRLRALRLAYFGRITPGATPHWYHGWNGPLYPPTLVRIDIDSGDGTAQPPLVIRLWAAPG